MKLVRQRFSRDCVIAACAMITGKSYEEVAAVAGQYENGNPGLTDEGILESFGYATAYRYLEHRHSEWPPKPFAKVHLCNVEVFENAPCTHRVVMLEDGTVLDPAFDEPRTLADYHKVNNVAAVVSYRAEMTNPQARSVET